MAIKGISIHHLSVAVRDVKGLPSVGDVFAYEGMKSDGLAHFVLCSTSFRSGSVEIKPLEGTSHLLEGFEVGASFLSVDGKSSFVVAAPGKESPSGAILQDVSPLTDISEYQMSYRHFALTLDARGKRWNHSFFDGTQFSKSNFNLSFLSIGAARSRLATYSGPDSPAMPCLLLSSYACLLKTTDVDYYMSNGATFMSSVDDSVVSSSLNHVVNMYDYALSSNLISKLSMSNEQIDSLSRYCIGIFTNPIDLSNGILCAKFIENGSTFYSNNPDSYAFLVNSQLNGSLVKVKCSAANGGIVEIKNINTLSDAMLYGSYQGDYANEFLQQDDYSLMFFKFNDTVACLGVCYFKDMFYNSGVSNVNGKFLPEGKNSLGAYATLISDSGNNAYINKVGTYFDSNFTQIVNIILSTHGRSVSAQSISIGDDPPFVDGNSVDRSQTKFDPVIQIDNYFVGESLPAIIEGRYGTDATCDNYVVGSAFLERNVRPILQNVNRKGYAAVSTGISYRPLYAYGYGHSKSYFVPMHGKMSLYIPYMSSLYERTSQNNFAIVGDIDIGLQESEAFKYKQASNIAHSGLSATENNSIYSALDGYYKYVRSDGSISNVVRHNDAHVLFGLAMQMLSFLGNNPYSNDAVINQSVIFGFSNHGQSAAVQLAFYLHNINRKISEVIYEGQSYLVSSEDRSLALKEMRRMISSIRNFYNQNTNSLYYDLIKVINDYSVKFPDSSIKDMKTSIIDAAQLLSQMMFFGTNFGDPEVDVFGMIRSGRGKVDLTSVSGSVVMSSENRNFTTKNVSTDVVNVLNIKSVSAVSTDPVWSGCRIYGGQVGGTYTFNGFNSYPNESSSLAVDAVVKKWISGIDEVGDILSGYIISSRDDIRVVDDSEMAARTQILVESVLNYSKSNANQDFKIGVSYSPVSYDGILKDAKSNLTSGYIISSDRIINRVIMPALTSGARLISQALDTDAFIIKCFDDIDNFSSSSVGLCLVENIYDPDHLSEYSLYNSSNIVAYFNGAIMSGSAGDKFTDIETLKGKNYFSTKEDFVQHAYPPGSDIVDSDVQFERFNLRRNIIAAYQNMLAAEISKISDFISTYNISDNPQRKSFSTAGGDGSGGATEVSSSVRLTNNLFGHNMLRSCVVSLGEEVLDSHFTHNIFSNPYTSLSSTDIFTFNSIDNFKIKKIFSRDSSFKDSYIERTKLIGWGRLLGVFPSPPNEFYTADGINVPSGEGVSHNEKDIIFNQPGAPSGSSGSSGWLGYNG